MILSCSLVLIVMQRGPAWLEGSVTLPGPLLGALAGLVAAAILLYGARRLGERPEQRQRAQERRQRDARDRP